MLSEYDNTPVSGFVLVGYVTVLLPVLLIVSVIASIVLVCPVAVSILYRPEFPFTALVNGLLYE